MENFNKKRIETFWGFMFRIIRKRASERNRRSNGAPVRTRRLRVASRTRKKISEERRPMERGRLLPNAAESGLSGRHIASMGSEMRGQE